jgi:hypothetical protein
VAKKPKTAAIDAALAKRQQRASALFDATLKNAPDLVKGAGPGALEALRDAYGVGKDYVQSRTPQQVAGDVAKGAGVVGDATARYATDRTQNPLKVLGDAYGVGKDIVTAVPQAVGDVAHMSERAQALKATDPAAARRMQAGIAMAALGAVPGVRAGKKAAKAVGEAEKLATQYGVAAPAIGHNRNIAADVLAEAASKSKGAQSFSDWRAANEDKLGTLFDYSRLSEVPDVPQTQMPRYAPARGPSDRIVSALADPRVVEGINTTVERGAAGGGRDWYNTDPLLERMRSAVGTTDAPSHYARLMDTVAATSPRSKVADNIRTGSYYDYLRANGMPIPDKPAGGYGSVAQDLHVGNVRGLESTGGWDIFKNPKPASFSTNLQGNQNNVTIDTHNMRLPGFLSEDPRMLAPGYDELVKPAKGEKVIDRNKIAADLLAKYPNMKGPDMDAFLSKLDKKKVTYRPRDWVKSGSVSMDEALKQPTFWDSKPKDNEYGYYEAWQQKQAKKLGMSPAQYQASMWLGGADETGLGSTPEPFLKTFEARVRYTADRLGLPPDVVLEEMLKGKTPLLAKGGRVDKAKLTKKYGVEGYAKGGHVAKYGYQTGGPAIPGNIDLHNRPVVHNADDSISTVRSITVGFGNKTYVLPTVIGDKVVSNKEAIDHFKKSGEHLGAFDTLADAEGYSQRLHEDQAKEYEGKAMGGLAEKYGV